MAYDPPSSLASFHSRYAPRREAERYVDAALSGRRPSVIFIVGGGLNYIGAALAERFPKALRVSLQPCSDFLGYEEDTPGISWHPSSASGLAAAIGAALSGDRIGGGVAVIEWPPVASRFPAETERIKAELKRALEAASSDSATSSYWAYRWLRNSLRFASSVSRVGSLVPGAAPIVIACAGPSLDDEISGLRRIRAGISLWALASAVPALLSRGLEPDIAVSTDPGFWNGYHVTAAVARAIPIAMPPSSFVPAEAYSGTSIIALNTGMSFERAAIEAAGVSARLADAGGSAAGTALSLALGLTTGPVALAGYDLAARGFDDHVAPYAFDALDAVSSSRASPYCSSRAARVMEGFPTAVGSWRTSRAFSAYASSIGAPPEDSHRVFRLGGSPMDTPLPRGALDDVIRGLGPEPAVIAEAKTGFSGGASRGALEEMLAGLGRRAFLEAGSAIRRSEPIPFEAALYYKALAPRDSARLIADAARGEAREEDLPPVDEASRIAGSELARMAQW